MHITDRENALPARFKIWIDGNTAIIIEPDAQPFERFAPVLITVAATVIALFPLASHGGPLWEAMCYAQIGGLTAATFITLLLVPVIYAICVLDLKVVKWAPRNNSGRSGSV